MSTRARVRSVYRALRLELEREPRGAEVAEVTGVSTSLVSRYTGDIRVENKGWWIVQTPLTPLPLFCEPMSAVLDGSRLVSHRGSLAFVPTGARNVGGYLDVLGKAIEMGRYE